MKRSVEPAVEDTKEDDTDKVEPAVKDTKD